MLEASPRLMRQDSQGFALSPHSSVHGGAAEAPIVFAIDEEVKEREPNGWEFSAYRVVTTYQGQMYTATRRFKEFKQLHLQLRAHIPSLGEFPLWGNLLNRFAPDVIEERKVGLRQFLHDACLLYTSPSPRDRQKSRMPSSA